MASEKNAQKGITTVLKLNHSYTNGCSGPRLTKSESCKLIQLIPSNVTACHNKDQHYLKEQMKQTQHPMMDIWYPSKNDQACKGRNNYDP